ncbi:MAG: hypothetical protein OEV92_05950, partial [Nitrospinota bacterium]|nr:hypothetical protein [Nitrospinota bacterium]
MPHHLETVNITDLAAGGAGVGKLADGKIVFAPQTFPGDVALLQIDKQKKRHAFASMVSLQTPSSLRRQPECPHVHDCGGCLWMELDYTAQLRWKKSVVEQTMGRIGRIDMEAKPVVPSPVKLGYRHRVRVKGAMTQNGFTFAYRRRGGNELAHISSCPVAHPRINQTMAGLAEFLSSRPTLAGSIDQTLFETDGGRCRATFFPTGAMSQSALEQMIGHVEGLDGATAMANGAILGQGGETWL